MINIAKELILLFILVGCQMKENINESEDYEIYVNQIINSFAKQMKIEFGLNCTGSGGKMPFDVENIEVDFVSFQRANIEEARKLEVIVTERFIEAINSHEKIRPFLREYPVKADRARIGILFKQQNKKPYTDGSVAYVFQVKNRIYYNADSETSPTLISLADEPYDEALKIVNGRR